MKVRRSKVEQFAFRSRQGAVVAAAAVIVGLSITPVRLAAQTADAAGAKSAISMAKSDVGYVLGAGDVVSIWVLGVEEIGDKPLRIDPTGSVDLPLVGRIRLGGLTVEQARVTMSAAFQRHVRNPKIAINVVEYHSEPVSVLGAVNSPGLQQLQGGRSLAEVISMAGGPRADAGYMVRITRRQEWGPIPLESAKPDPSGKFSVAEVKLQSLLEAQEPAENIPVKPYDVISIPRAQLVYVIGDVNKPGGFALNERESVSVLQAVSLAGGMVRTAKGSEARILRGGASDAKKEEIVVNINQILDGKSADVPLQSDDLLYIPSSAAKRGAIRAIEASIAIATGLVIFRPR